MRRSIIAALPSVTITVFVFLAAASAALAQPSVTTTSGSWSHKSTVTIAGAGFGAKATAAPVVWDDASGASVSDKWDAGWPNCAGNADYNLAYRTPSQAGRSIPLPHTHATKYISGAHFGPIPGPDCSYAVMMWKVRTISSFPAYSYASWYQRADDNWHFDNGGDDNFKTFAYSAGVGPYNLPTNWYMEYNPVPANRLSIPTWHLNDDAIGTASQSLQSPDQNGHSFWWGDAVNPMGGAWSKIEMETKYTNQDDGYIRMWENGVLVMDYHGSTDRLPGTQRTEGIGGYARDYPDTSNWRFFSDVYLDYSRARVVLGDAPTLAASTIREVQVPTAWSDSSISVSVNLGALTDHQTAYLYVVDANGHSNAAGVPIDTDTGPNGPPDTVVPTVSLTTPANASSVSGVVQVVATASDNVAVVGVTLKVDGVSLGVEDTTAPYSFSWNSWTATNGSHVLTAVARDAVGNENTSSPITVTTNNVSAPTTTGLVASYAFDDGSGTTLSDASGFDQPGTISGGASWASSGHHGSALSFDGVDDLVTIADAPAFDLEIGMTLEAWLKPSSLSGWQTALMKTRPPGPGEPEGGLSYALYANNGTPNPAATVNTGGGDREAAGVSPLPVGTWTHLAATYDGAMLRLFVNGIERASHVVAGPLVSSTRPLFIGGNEVWGEYFAGLIDEVRIYNRALSAAQILVDMATPVVAPPLPDAPTLTTIAPATVAMGGAAFTLTVTGTGFISTSTVQVDGVPRATTFDSATQLSATILATDIASSGTHSLTVVTPAPGGGTSSAAVLTVTAPAPTLTTIAPASVAMGGPAFTLTVTGTGFVSTSIVHVDGVPRTTTFNSPTQLSATIPAADIATPGTHNLTVVTPAPGGGTSSAAVLTVTAPAPTLTTIAPASVAMGGPAFTLTVTGTGFISTSTVQVDGGARPTTFDSVTQLSATILAVDIASPGTHSLTVVTPAPGGGTSSAAVLTVTAPAPTLTTIAPTTVTMGGPTFTLTVTGTGFVSTSIVHVDGVPRTTTFNSPTQLSATIPAADIATPGTHNLTVVTPAPGGGTSNGATLTISAPTPTLTTIAPTSVAMGGPTFALTVTGTGFISTSTVQVDGAPRATTFDSPTQLSATILAADITSPGTATITVVTPAPGGGTSSAAVLTVTAPAPTLTTIAPTSVAMGGPAFTLTVTGTGFISTSTVQVDGAPRVTTFDSATQLQATILATDIASPGTHSLTVVTPAPGGGTSTAAVLTVTAPAPTLTTIAPTSVAMGGPAFTLTVTGTGFISTSTVQLDGVSRTTTFDSPTQLSATILATDIASPGTHSLTVVTPAPGGGTSTAAVLTVTAPAPTLTAIAPATVAVGGPAFTLTVTGTGFISTSTVQVDGAPRVTTFDSATQLQVTILATDIASSGMHSLTVVTPAPGGGTSTAAVLTVTAPTPTLATIAPASVAMSGPEFTLTVTGTGFISTSTVQVDGVPRATTLDSATQLSATILAGDIASPGTHTITVVTPAPGGGTSSAVVLTVTAPAPTLTTIAPTSVAMGGPSFTLTVTGTGFISTSTVQVDGAPRVTTFDSATQLQATILATDIASPGTHSLTVVTPAPGGGTSTAAVLTVTAPAPTLTTIAPTTVTMGGPTFTLTVTGTGFVSTSIVHVDGVPRTTTFNSPTQLSATIPAADIATPGTHSLTVVTPAPGGGTSNGATLTISAPAPTLTTIAPTSVAMGGPTFTLTVTGTGFINTSTAQVDGAARPTTFDSSTQLRATILVADLASPGTHSLTVVTPAPGGGTSNGATLTVTAPAPTATTIAPTSVAMGGPAFTLTVTGTGFISTSTVQVDGVPRATTLDSATQLSATILATDIAAPGTHSLTVVTPAPGGGTSSTAVLTVTAPAPTLTTIAPATVAVGGPAFTLTVTGTGFISTSTVQVDGAPRVTTFDSATQLQATILATDIASPGTHSLTVVTPAPGGGTSTAAVLTVTAPTPTLATIAPASVAMGGPEFTLTVTGTGFISTSTVQVDGAPRATTFDSATQLSATILATDIAAPGTHSLTVVTPAPGGGTSNGATLTISAPAPTLTTIAPTSVAMGGPAFTLTVTGTGFISTSTVQVDGVLRATTFDSPTQLHATILATDIAGSGTATITVVTPAPGGGTSSAAVLTVTAPTPTLATIAPASVAMGGPQFTLTVTGTGFISTSTVQVDGTARATTFDSATQLSATILATDIAAPGTHSLTVVTPAPGGGVSASAPLTITAPAPTITTLAPTSVAAGGPAFTLTVTGTGFVASSSVQWDGAARATTFDSATQLRAAILATDIATGGMHSVTVVTPAPGGGTSNSVLLPVGPALTAGATSVAPGGTMTFTIANGPGNSHDWLGLYCPTTLGDSSFGNWKYLNDTQTAPTMGLTAATVTLAAPTTIGATCQARLFADGGYTKLATSATVTVANPVPTLTNLIPTSVLAGSATFTLTVTGTGFVANSTVQWDGASRTTTVVSATQVTVTIMGTDVAALGTHTITVVNPAPGGGTSNGLTLTVTAPPPAPTITTLAPTSVAAGGSAFTLTVTGTGFVATSSVRWDGAGRATTFDSATQLRAAILATDIASGGVHSVTVVTPAPGGGTSNVVMLPVIGPTLTAGATSVAPGGTMTFTIANGPGNSRDWMGLYCPTTLGDSGFTNWKYLNDTQTAPAMGLTAAAVTFTAPTTIGATCQARLFADSGYTRLATSGTVTVANPVPALTNLMPASVTVGSAAFTLTVTGTGFVGTSSVQWDGSARATTFVSATQVTVAIASTDVAALGTHTIAVVNPAPGGGTSNGVALTVTAPPPAPTMTTLAPTSVAAGGPAFTLTVTGTGFVATSSVHWDGAARATTFDSATQLRAAILAADLASPGMHNLTVVTPAPGGGTSNVVMLPVIGPTLTAGATSVAPGGTMTFTIANGPGNPRDWMGLYCPATLADSGFTNWKYLNDTQTVPAMGLTAATVTFTAPLTIGATCQARLFANDTVTKLATSGTVTVANPLPTLTSLMPASGAAGGPAFTLTVTGTGFVATSSVHWDGAARATTFDSATQLRAAIPASDIASGGAHNLTVMTPAPGGGTSNAVVLTVVGPVLMAGATSVAPGGTMTFTIGSGPGNPRDWVGLYCPTTLGDSSLTNWKYLNDAQAAPLVGLTAATVTFTAPTALGATCQARLFENDTLTKRATSGTVTVANPMPTLTSVLPTSVTAGAPAFTLTVTGSGFVGTSSVQWDGAARATTFDSATQLRAAILPADIASSGTHSLTVVTPSPGGGASNAIVLPVAGATLTAGTTGVAPGGTITFTVGNGPGNLRDWVGLYCPMTEADGSFMAWKYLSDTQAPPLAGLTAATVTFAAPATLGATCQARLFANDSLVKLATSGAATVTTSTIAAPQSGVPFGGQIAAIAVDPMQANTIYVATSGAGVFKSTAGGAGWTAVNSGLANTTLRSLAIDYTNPNVVYAGGLGGIFETVDGGQHWAATNVGVTDTDIVPIVIDPVNSSTVYAGSKGGRIYKTTNGGANWTSGPAVSGSVWTLAIDPTNPAVVYAGTVIGGVFRSADGGASWISRNAGLANLNVRSLVVDPASPATIYAGTDGGFFASADFGAHWTSPAGAIRPTGVQTVTLDPTNSSTVYVGSFLDGIYKSTDRGVTWIRLNTGLTNGSLTTISALAVDPTSPTTVYAGADNTGIFKTTTAGALWNSDNPGLSAMKVTGLSVDPTVQTPYAATNGGGMFKSSDRGNTWTPASTGLADVYVASLVMDPQHPSTLYAGGSSSGAGVGIYVTHDSGAHWVSNSVGLPSQTVLSLAVDPVNTVTVYAGVAGNGVFKSSDGGSHWLAANIGLEGLTVFGIAIDPLVTTTVYANATTGLFKSTDGAGSWTRISSSVFGGSLAVDPSTPTTIYASGNGLFKSTNGGTSWTSISVGIPSSDVGPVAIDPMNPSVLYAGTGTSRSSGSVFKSPDGGTSWAQASDGLTTTGVVSIAIDPTNPSVIYAGTYSGTFESTDGGATWH